MGFYHLLGWLWCGAFSFCVFYLYEKGYWENWVVIYLMGFPAVLSGLFFLLIPFAYFGSTGMLHIAAPLFGVALLGWLVYKCFKVKEQ